MIRASKNCSLRPRRSDTPPICSSPTRDLCRLWVQAGLEYFNQPLFVLRSSSDPTLNLSHQLGGGGGGGGGGVGVGDGSCGPGGFVIFVIGDDADNSVSNVKPFSTFAFPGACTETFSSVASGRVWADGNRFARPGLRMKDANMENLH